MLYDKNFLLQLDEQKNKTIYAKITSLTFEELPIESLEGRVSQGTINIDGKSALRRTCSLTILLDDYNYNNYNWSLHTKFKLEIGVKNSINSTYPDIIWFNQGIYLITSFNTSKTTNNFTLSISGKDKMCLLNGDVGGTIEAITDFGQLEETVDDFYILKKIPIKEIIKNLVSIYGKELSHNIIINNLDMPGVELLEYRYDTPMYLYKKAPIVTDDDDNNKETDAYENIIIENDSSKVYIDGENGKKEELLKNLSYEYFDLLVDGLNGVQGSKSIYLKENNKFVKYNFAKISYGQTAGYRETDLVYPGDLIANTGESITSILDKIKNIFVDFEYFYDLDGRFIFQQKKSSIKTLWNKGNDPINFQNMNEQNISYIFNNSDLLISLNNTPNLLNIKNDFSIWGERESISGAKIPIHIRYAIDTKPKKYTTIYVSSEEKEVNEYANKYNIVVSDRRPEEYRAGKKWSSGYEEISLTKETYIPNHYYYKLTKNKNDSKDPEFDENGTFKSDRTYYIYYHICDWREIIYQMANDYYKYNFLSDFQDRILENNSAFIGGKTGYENYYSDIFGFWRDIYDPEINEKINTYRGSENEDPPNSVSNKILGSLAGCKKAIIDWGKENQKIEKNLETEEDEEEIKVLQHDYRENQLNILKEKEKIKVWKEQGKKIIGWPILTEKYFSVISDLQNRFKAFFTKQEIEKLDNELEEDPGLIRQLQEKEFLFYNTGLKEGEEEKKGWLKDVFLTPENLIFWFDFLDTSGEISKNSVKNIGQRLTAIKDTQVKSIYNRDTPDILFVETLPENKLDGYKYIKISNLEEMFSVSSQGISAYNKLGELLNKHSNFVENISITTTPIYYLEPGTIIQINDKDIKLSGDYVIDKITLNLSHNGTMQMSGNKLIDEIV